MGIRYWRNIVLCIRLEYSGEAETRYVMEEILEYAPIWMITLLTKYRGRKEMVYKVIYDRKTRLYA